jgi:hypothetical protein
MPLLVGVVEAPSLLTALTARRLAVDAQERIRVLLPESEAGDVQDERRSVTDGRNWHAGVHAGSRTVRVRSLDRSAFVQGAAP